MPDKDVRLSDSDNLLVRVRYCLKYNRGPSRAMMLKEINDHLRAV